MVDEPADGFYVGLAARQWEGHSLVFGEGFAEGCAGLGVIDGCVKRPLGETE